MFDKLYRWTISLAQRPHAVWGLAAVAFAESSFFPLPPDIILAPMVVARPGRAFFYAGVCTLASVFGGMLGYAIGALLFDTVGQWLINLYGYADKLQALREFYAQWGWAFILVKGMTPIPFKLVTIVSGILGYNFPLFVGLCILTRGARFFLVAGVLNYFGEPLRAALEKHFGWFLLIILVSVIAGFYLVAHMF